MRAAEAEGPLTADEVEELLAPVVGARRLALAVSGGADSLALLVAVDRWRRQPGRPHVTVFTVDHGLRAGSDAEALHVLATAKARGLSAECLVWAGPHPETDIEASARTARYRLLLAATRQSGASHLLLGHHRDDQAETFLMRLQRGSGVFGLAAMRREVAAGNTVIFRPFLSIPRSRLSATTAAAGLVPVDDPMNADPRFTRARLRPLMPLLAAEGFDPALLAATAGRMAEAAAVVDAAVDGVFDSAAMVDAFGVVAIPDDAFREAAPEVQLRLIARLVMALGGDAYPPRSERLRGLRTVLVAGTGRTKRTLGGAMFERRRRPGRVLAYRELGRAGPPARLLEPGQTLVWDRRFRITCGPNLPRGTMVEPLGEARRRTLGLSLDAVPAAAVAALPALCVAGTVAAVPGLWSDGSRLDVDVAGVLAGRLRQPARFPDDGVDVGEEAFTVP